MAQRGNTLSSKKGRKIGRSVKEPKHISYNQRHHYTAHSNPKATHHRTPLERYHMFGIR